MVRTALSNMGLHKKLASDWPVIFAVAVVCWLGLSALGMPGAADTSASDDANDAPAAETVSYSGGSLDIEVRSFRVDGSTVELTLDLHNNTESNTSFSPQRLALITAEGITRSADDSTPQVEVGPDVDVIVPAVFEVPSGSGGPYRLKYGSIPLAGSLGA